MPADGYTTHAVDAMSEAITAGEDLAGWLATALAHVAARHGGSQALTARRPGSWEAGLVDRLVRGTIGRDDEDLSHYGQPVPRTQGPELTHDGRQTPGSRPQTRRNS